MSMKEKIENPVDIQRLAVPEPDEFKIVWRLGTKGIVVTESEIFQIHEALKKFIETEL